MFDTSCFDVVPRSDLLKFVYTLYVLYFAEKSENKIYVNKQ